MVDFATNQFKSGLKVLIDNDPYSILQNEYVKPGKGQAFNRVKLRNLKTGRVIDKTFKSGDKLPGADVNESEMTFLYADDDFYYFMDAVSYEQKPATYAAAEQVIGWIKDGDACTVTTFNGDILLVEPPNFVELRITECEPSVKGDTVSGGSKEATLETGKVIRVPLFVNEDEIIKIDTRSGDYVSRVK
ncbi:MAG: elongation factor P [Legionellales bacterium]|nr:elongation factor P [Legionellales bacterium]